MLYYSMARYCALLASSTELTRCYNPTATTAKQIGDWHKEEQDSAEKVISSNGDKAYYEAGASLFEKQV